MFSSAFLAFTTPVCKSARTLVVPPGVRDIRRLGDTGGWRVDEDAYGEPSVSIGESFEPEEAVGRWVAG